MFLKLVTAKELVEFASSFKSGKESRVDQIEIDDVKCHIDLLAGPLSYITGSPSTCAGVVPGDIKTGRVIPIYKKDTPYHFGNYGPISILPAFSSDR